MTRLSLLKWSLILVTGLSATIADNPVFAQIIRAPLGEGFQRSSSIAMNMDEMLGTKKVRAASEPIVGPGAPDLWIAEVQFKPVRLIRLPVTDPKTGVTTNELVRYMVYRAIRRDYTELAGAEQAELQRKLSDPNLDPTNQLDAEVSVPLQMPRFILETQETDGSSIETYLDEVNLEIQRAVFDREMGRRGRNLRLFNSVEAISEIGEPVPSSDPDPLSKALYGVAVWRNVDPKADFFAVYMSGFCNSYRISTDASGKTVVEEKVVVQKFARPGDEFLQEEMEFRLIDDGVSSVDGKPIRYPAWQYRVRPVQLDVKGMDTILRNIRSASAADAGN